MTSFLNVFSWRASSPPPENQNQISKQFRSFSEDEDGIATVWSMFWLIICFALSGLAIDATNAWKVQQFLQSTADSAALAGSIELLTVDNNGIEALVEEKANLFAALNMGPTRYGDVLIDQDITVGYWDGAAFTPMVAGDTVPVNAVRTVTRQNETQNHAVGTFFLRFIGFNEFTIATMATAKIFTARCDFDGIIAQGHVKLSTKQQFLDEYCVHGELGIDISQDNYFEEGTIAGMKDLSTCGPSEGHCLDDANLGIEDALRQMSLSGGKTARIDDYLETLSTNLSNTDVDEVNAYIVSLLIAGDPNGYTGPETVIFTPKPNEPLDVSLLLPGVINYIDCPRDGFDVKLEAEVPPTDPVMLENMVIMGNGCDFTFDPTYNFSNSVIATNATGTQTLSGASGVVLGDDDNQFIDGENVCGEGGEVTLITAGSVNFASKLSAYDLEIIARDDVHLAAKANDMGDHIGTNISAGGDVQVTTGHTFYGCEGRTVSVFDPIMSWALVE